MPLISLILALIVVGVLLGLLNHFGPPYVDGRILNIINAVVVIAVVLWIVSLFIGGFGSLDQIRIGR